jgi:uncharacterized protein YbjT (DUF2867 family)
VAEQVACPGAQGLDPVVEDGFQQRLPGGEVPVQGGGAEAGAAGDLFEHIRALGLPATILRPVSFMENFSGGYYLRDGTLSAGLRPDVPLQLIAVDDVGAFAALAFGQPGRYAGQTLEITGDELTLVQAAAAISQATGYTVPYVQVPIETIRTADPHAAIASQWLNDQGYHADIPALRELYPALMDFSVWLSAAGAAKIQAALAGRHG